MPTSYSLLHSRKTRSDAHAAGHSTRHWVVSGEVARRPTLFAAFGAKCPRGYGGIPHARSHHENVPSFTAFPNRPRRRPRGARPGAEALALCRRPRSAIHFRLRCEIFAGSRPRDRRHERRSSKGLSRRHPLATWSRRGPVALRAYRHHLVKLLQYGPR